jgi:hypothetical protein
MRRVHGLAVPADLVSRATNALGICGRKRILI